MGLAEAFGHEFADDDREIGDRRHDDERRQGACAAGFESPPGEARGYRLGQHGLADDAIEDADRGDADLHGRHEAGWILSQCQRRRRTAVATLGSGLQARAARGDERDLRHRKQSVENDQGAKDGDFHADSAVEPRGAPAPAAPCHRRKACRL